MKTSIERILTIGVYGYNARSFLGALRVAGVDLLVDIRARRGVRGAEYSFANSARLQAALQDSGIKYVHAKELAPSQSIRDSQHDEDAANGIPRRSRAELGNTFTEAYRRECLASLDLKEFAMLVLGGHRRPALLCVEREPAACHRSLAADALAKALSVRVVHLMPTEDDPLNSSE